MGEIRQILKKKKILFVFKGYICRFKSEAFASFASIAIRPWVRVARSLVFFVVICILLFVPFSFYFGNRNCCPSIHSF